MRAQDIIEKLQLEPLPDEGGYFRRIYTHPEVVTLADGRTRPLQTIIYYLMTEEHFSALHRVASEETFHFHGGDAVEMFQLAPDGTGQVLRLGNDIAAGELPCAHVPAGAWQGMRIAERGTHGYALFTTVVSPGFAWEDFELGEREALVAAFPDWQEEITRLTR